MRLQVDNSAVYSCIFPSVHQGAFTCAATCVFLHLQYRFLQGHMENTNILCALFTPHCSGEVRKNVLHLHFSVLHWSSPTISQTSAYYCLLCDLLATKILVWDIRTRKSKKMPSNFIKSLSSNSKCMCYETMMVQWIHTVVNCHWMCQLEYAALLTQWVTDCAHSAATWPPY